MRKSKFSEEQIVGVLKEIEAGGKAKDACRRLGISEQTLYRWKAKYGGMRQGNPGSAGVRMVI